MWNEGLGSRTLCQWKQSTGCLHTGSPILPCNFPYDLPCLLLLTAFLRVETVSHCGKGLRKDVLVTRQWSWCLPDSLLRVRFWQVWQCTWCKGRQVAPGAFCIAIPHFKPEMAYSKSHPLLYQTQLSTLSRWISLCGQLGHCVVSSTGFPFVVGGQNIFLPAASRNVHATQEGFILPPLNGMAAIQQAWEHV